MKKFCEIKGAVRTNACKVVVDNKEYTVMAQYTPHGVDNARAVYYLFREDNPDLAIQCGASTAAVHYLDNNFADFWFWAEVQRYGSKMAERYENEIMKIRKVG